MDITPSIQLGRPQRRRKRRAVGSQPTPAPLLLASVADVQVFGGQLQMNLNFNTPDDDPMSDPVGADPTKWTARYQGQTWVGTSVSFVFLNTLFLLMDPVGAEAGADVLNYSNAPSDISDTLGRFLGAFTGYPIAA